MLNIKDITKTKYYNDPTGGIITIGNNILNKHNFIINIDYDLRVITLSSNIKTLIN